MPEPAWKWPPGSTWRHWYPDGRRAACGRSTFVGTPTPAQLAALAAPGPIDCPRCWPRWRQGYPAEAA
jgi:hypothetical protein